MSILAKVRNVSLRRTVVHLVLLMALLAVLLKGTLPKTYLERSFSGLETQLFSYGVGESSPWDWRFDWTKTDVGVSSVLAFEKDVLSLETVFSEGSTQLVKIRRDVGLTVPDFPVFRVRAWVSRGAMWHVRLFCVSDESGSRALLRSPLENLMGTSSWKTHSIEIEGLTASEGIVGKVVAVEIALENPHLWYSHGVKRLMISEIAFLSKSSDLKLSWRGDGNLNDVSDGAIFGLPPEALPRSGWVMRWLTLEFQATANVPFEYKVIFVHTDKPAPTGFVGPSFISQPERLTDFYRLDIADEPIELSMEELTFLSKFIRGPCLVVTKIGFEEGGFTSFALSSVRIVYHLPLSQIAVPLTEGLVQQMLLLLVCIVFLVPVGALALAFKGSLSGRRVTLAFLIYVGLASRIALCFFTGHTYDMEVWSYCARSFYESGAIDARNAPLPVTNYVVLLGSVPYSALRWFGFQDMRFLSHITGVVESAFIKFPFILSDLAAMLLLVRILRKLGDKRAVEHASLYWLNPLTILLSGVWGMYDTVAVTFLLFGLASLFLDRRWGESAVFFTLSTFTKGFGIIGFIPLLIVLVRDRKIVDLAWSAATGACAALLIFLPVFLTGGLRAVLDVGREFMRGRAGMGSQASTPGASYMSFFDLIGLRPQAFHLNILLFMIVLCLGGWLVYKLKDSRTETRDIEAIALFASLAMITAYLSFFRIYEQYYLWILPFLTLLSFAFRKATLATAGFMLGSIVGGIVVPLGLLLAGRLYYFTPVSLPAEGAIIAVLPTFIVVATLLSVVDLRRIRGDWISLADYILLVSLGGWLSVEGAYLAYYGVLSLRHAVWAAAIAVLFLLVHSNRIVERLTDLLMVRK